MAVGRKPFSLRVMGYAMQPLGTLYSPLSAASSIGGALSLHKAASGSHSAYLYNPLGPRSLRE